MGTRWSPARAHAFTLIELIATVVVVGVLATVSIVSYGQFTKQAEITAGQTTLEQVAVTTLGQARLKRANILTRADVQSAFASAGENVTLGGPADVPSTVGQFTVAFLTDAGEVSDTGGTSAAVATYAGGQVIARVFSLNGGAPGPVALPTPAAPADLLTR